MYIDFVDIARRSSARLVSTSNWSILGILSRRAGLSSTAGLCCWCYCQSDDIGVWRHYTFCSIVHDSKKQDRRCQIMCLWQWNLHSF